MQDEYFSFIKRRKNGEAIILLGKGSAFSLLGCTGMETRRRKMRTKMVMQKVSQGLKDDVILTYIVKCIASSDGMDFRKTPV